MTSLGAMATIRSRPHALSGFSRGPRPFGIGVSSKSGVEGLANVKLIAPIRTQVSFKSTSPRVVVPVGLVALTLLLTCACGDPSTSFVELRLSEVSCRDNDWIEFTSSLPIDLSGLRVEASTDDDAYVFSEGARIRPGEFLVLYRRRELPFAIRCGETTLTIRSPNGDVVGTVAPPELYEGQSWGALPDSEHVGLLRPTAGSANEVTPIFAEEEPTLDPPSVGSVGEGRCADATRELGFLVCADGSVDSALFEALSVQETFSTEISRVGKYTVPVFDDDELSSLLQNVARFHLHQDFLAKAFPRLFPNLDAATYAALTMNRATRRYFTGSLYQFADMGPFGFSVATDPLDDEESLELEEVQYCADQIASLLDREVVAYVPRTSTDINSADSWPQPGFPVRILAGGVDSQSQQIYTPGVAYGRVRSYSVSDLEIAQNLGQIGWQDIVVVDEAPADLETVVAAVVTGSPQVSLSHLAVRADRRGTPNLFVDGARAAFAAYEGSLVRLEAYSTDFVVGTDVSQSEAEDFWARNRPTISVQTADLDEVNLSSLSELDITTPELRENAIRRYGAKGVQTAVLNSLLDEAHQRSGILVPFHWYDRFMHENYTTVDEEDVTYHELLEGMLADSDFRSDVAIRRERLDSFQRLARDEGVLPEGLEQILQDRIVEVFGSEHVMVRFRSSSNAEDNPGFPGAGLYDSRSACTADSTDTDDEIPSRCDPSTAKERTLRDALLRVWTSLWNSRAHEEREYYQLDASGIAMGVLVTERVSLENATGVLLADLPDGDGAVRLEVQAQWGEIGVVRPEVGMLAERDLLIVASDNSVTVLRMARSNAIPEGFVVLTKDHLVELAAIIAPVVRDFPLDGVASDDLPRARLEMEWKLDKEQRFIIKQARILLRPLPPTPDGLLIATPNQATLCSTFVDDRSIWQERLLRGQIDIGDLDMLLPFTQESYPIEAEWVREVRFGPDQERLEPDGPGTFGLEVFSGGLETHLFHFQQRFLSSDGPINVLWEHRIRSEANTPVVGEALSIGSESDGFSVCSGDCTTATQTPFLSCTMSNYPIWEHSFEIADEEFPYSRVEIRVRFREEPVESGPLRILSIQLFDQHRQVAEVDDFFGLAYATHRHNQAEQFLARLPEGSPGVYLLVDEPNLGDPHEAGLLLLDQTLGPINTVRTTDFVRAPLEER